MTDYEEKAREIVIKMQFQKEPLMFESAKICGLIAVDEILKNIDATILYHKNSKALPINKEYWLQVRTSLNAL
jgi:hypothetical protein